MGVEGGTSKTYMKGKMSVTEKKQVRKENDRKKLQKICLTYQKTSAVSVKETMYAEFKLCQGMNK